MYGKGKYESEKEGSKQIRKNENKSKFWLMRLCQKQNEAILNVIQEGNL